MLVPNFLLVLNLKFDIMMNKNCELGFKVDRIMIITTISVVLIVSSIDTTSTADAQNTTSTWKSSFDLQDCEFASVGYNTYFIL